MKNVETSGQSGCELDEGVLWAEVPLRGHEPRPDPLGLHEGLHRWKDNGRGAAQGRSHRLPGKGQGSEKRKTPDF